MRQNDRQLPTPYSRVREWAIDGPLHSIGKYGIWMAIYRIFFREWDVDDFFYRMIDYMLKDNVGIGAKDILSLPKDRREGWYNRNSYRDRNHYERFKRIFIKNYIRHCCSNAFGNRKYNTARAMDAFGYFNLMWGLRQDF
ncbi:hypothetical protein EOM86_07505 [Candidatus Nomurabacteria bacterium]|nr:hypothetical protein [Candidatus Nomurabacteria bacterium]